MSKDQPVGLIRDDDACIFFNFRADRGREMTEALTSATLERPARAMTPKNLHFTTMTQYDKSFTAPFVLTREPLDNILANVFAQLNWKNLRVAETEKYAHVTYFFNGGVEKPFAGEERELVASPKVATYDLKPEMSADGITEVIVDAMGKKDFDVIVMNFANADMVGHSGKMEPTVRAVEDRGCVPGAHLAAAEREERAVDYNGRSRQCGDDDRSGDARAAHVSHDESGAADSGGRFGRQAAGGMERCRISRRRFWECWGRSSRRRCRGGICG